MGKRLKALEEQQQGDAIMSDRLYRKGEVELLEGIGPTTLHHRLCRGEYETVADGTSQPKITGRSILRRRELHLRPAQYGLRAGIKGLGSSGRPRKGGADAPLKQTSL